MSHCPTPARRKKAEKERKKSKEEARGAKPHRQEREKEKAEKATLDRDWRIAQDGVEKAGNQVGAVSYTHLTLPTTPYV